VLDHRIEMRRIDARVATEVARRIVLPVGLLLLTMIALGRVATRLPLGEDGLNRWFADHRSGPLNGVSAFFSLVGDTYSVIAVTVICAAIMLLRLRSRHAPIFLCAAVTAQAIVFFFTTLAIDRQRPRVPKMDDSPPTSSFPSGHTSAAVALYGGLALVLSVVLRQTWAKALAWSLLLFPVGVAVSRMYRGMHHASDVTASFLNGGLCITIMAFAILWGGIFRTSAARR
jgi:undecaprenyl-diphosphatase